MKVPGGTKLAVPFSLSQTATLAVCLRDALCYGTTFGTIVFRNKSFDTEACVCAGSVVPCLHDSVTTLGECNHGSSHSAGSARRKDVEAT
jgi:hypothetical protein